MVAPEGVAASDTTALACDGSLVKTLSEPVSVSPAVAEPGTVAVTVMDPEVPGATSSSVGDTENADPVVLAVTTSVAVPLLLIVKVPVPDEPHDTVPTSRRADEYTAIGTPPSTLASAVLASGVAASSFAAPSGTVWSALASLTLAAELIDGSGGIGLSSPCSQPDASPMATPKSTSNRARFFVWPISGRRVICRAPTRSSPPDEKR